jgi:hypothetical protein
MDGNAIGVLVPVVAIATWGAVKIARVQSNARAFGADPRITQRIDALEQEVGTLRQELSETHERLDFTERLLAQHRTDRLDAPK